VVKSIGHGPNPIPHQHHPDADPWYLPALDAAPRERLPRSLTPQRCPLCSCTGLARDLVPASSCARDNPCAGVADCGVPILACARSCMCQSGGRCRRSFGRPGLLTSWTGHPQLLVPRPATFPLKAASGLCAPGLRTRDGGRPNSQSCYPLMYSRCTHGGVANNVQRRGRKPCSLVRDAYASPHAHDLSK
jgi:hypothetical protein